MNHATTGAARADSTTTTNAVPIAEASMWLMCCPSCCTTRDPRCTYRQLLHASFMHKSHVLCWCIEVRWHAWPDEGWEV
jgi:hypothetical protein